jgi:hypothetical protein
MPRSLRIASYRKRGLKREGRRRWKRMRAELLEHDAWLDFKARSDARAAIWSTRRPQEHRPRTAGQHDHPIGHEIVPNAALVLPRQGVVCD